MSHSPFDSPQRVDKEPAKPYLLQEGDIIFLKAGTPVYAMIEGRFIYSNSNSTELVHHEARVAIDTKYVVYKTAWTGGGTGHGANDVYPDGHRVYCEPLDDPDPKRRIDFYQSGSFTIVHKNIQPIGKAVHKWVEL